MLQHNFISQCIVISLLLPATMPMTLLASNETNNCHCFRNRTFNPNDKFASDEYRLTTTFNSLLASAFNITKRRIVMMKMQDGIANNELITSLFISKAAGVSVPKLLKMRNDQTWSDILAALRSRSKSADIEDLLSVTKPNPVDEQIAEHISHRIIANRFSPAPDSFKKLRDNNLTHREITLVYTLAEHTGLKEQDIAAQHLQNGLSWSEITHNFGLEPSAAGKLLHTD